MRNLEEILIEIDSMNFLESSAFYGIFFIVIALIVGVLYTSHKEDKMTPKKNFKETVASIGVFIVQYIVVISMAIATVLIPGAIIYGIVGLIKWLF